MLNCVLQRTVEWICAAKGNNGDSEHDEEFPGDLDGKSKAPPSVALIMVVGVEVKENVARIGLLALFPKSERNQSSKRQHVFLRAFSARCEPSANVSRRWPPTGYRIVADEQRSHRTKKTPGIDPFQTETVRLIFRLAWEGNGTSGAMGVKSIAKHLNAAGIRTRDGGCWGIDAVHKVLTRTAYVGRHRFNTKFWKTRERKPETEVVEMMVPAIIEVAEFEAVQAHLKARSPAWTAPRIVSGPTLLTGIFFCAACGMAMTLRTGKIGRYRYCTCSTKARHHRVEGDPRSGPCRH